MIDKAISFQKPIYQDGEYNYAAAYGFVPNVYAYLHDDDEVRPGMIVVPGGGYCMVVNVEGEPVAEYFYNMGMNVVVLTYTTDITMSVPLKDQPMKDLSRAIRYIRANVGTYRMDPAKLSICGFSAGGHLCASICTHYGDVTDSDEALNAISNRPDAVVLGYPVITSGDFTHIYSIWALIGQNASEEEMTYYSLEKQAHKDMPPCFIWQTVEDDLVPVENSMFFAEACRKAGVPYAYYAFPTGGHGMAAIAGDRIKTGDFGEAYTFDQVNRAVEAVREGKGINVSDQRRTELMIQFFGSPEGKKPEPKEDGERPPMPPMPSFADVAMWPALCGEFLKKQKVL